MARLKFKKIKIILIKLRKVLNNLSQNTKLKKTKWIFEQKNCKKAGKMKINKKKFLI
jgi:hypothetical protein